MKYLFLLLVLAGCTKENTTKLSPKEQETARKNLAFRDKIISNYYNPPPPVEAVRPPRKERGLFPDEEDYYEKLYPNISSLGAYEDEESETIPISDYEVSIYLTNINPYRKEYKQFFEEQLNIYGRNDIGQHLVSLEEIRSICSKYNVFIFIWENNNRSTSWFRIVEHGKTNWYPLPSNH